MPSILLFGARAPVTLELCRAFAGQGYQIFLADVTLFPIARWSNFAKQYFRVPPPAQQFTAFREAVLHLVQKHQIEHLIPTCEETFYISKFKDELPCEVWTSTFDLLIQLHHKHHFLDLAKGFFNIPATCACTDFQDWQHAETYVFKPVFSRFASKVIIGQPAHTCEAPRKNPQHWIAQKRLTGQEVCVYSVWRKGELGGFASYLPQYRVGQGASVYFEGFYDQRIFDAVQQFGAFYQFHGQLSFDLMLCQDGVYVLECNPRATSGAHFLGNDLAAAFFSNSTLIHRSTNAKVLALAWRLSHPRNLFSKALVGAEDVIWHWRDMAPYFLQILSVGELLYLAVRHQKSLLEVSTRDIEYNGQIIPS